MSSTLRRPGKLPVCRVLTENRDAYQPAGLAWVAQRTHSTVSAFSALTLHSLAKRLAQQGAGHPRDGCQPHDGGRPGVCGVCGERPREPLDPPQHALLARWLVGERLWCHGTRCVGYARGWCAYGVRTVRGAPRRAALRLRYLQLRRRPVRVARTYSTEAPGTCVSAQCEARWSAAAARPGRRTRGSPPPWT